MTIDKFLEKGYFIKELPPCFSTKQFSENITEIISEWKSKFNSMDSANRRKYTKSMCIKFSYPKQEMNRRQLSIPNPLHYTELTKEIIDNWEELQNKFKDNKRSYSLPVKDMKSRAIKAKSDSFTDFQEAKINLSYNSFYELKIDISKFYDSIYTHTVAWAIHGKKEAKEKIYDSSILGNKIDKKLRNCQDGQSIGIPTGPDISFFLSELILNDIDNKIKNNIEFCRFADDIYLYSNKKDELYKKLKEINKILLEYKLSINESKLKIKKFPFKINEEWIDELEKIEKEIVEEKKQRKAIINFFNIIFIEMERSGKNQILKYGQYKLLDKNISSENWEIFESLLLKSILISPEIIKSAILILKKYETLVNKNKLRVLINKIIELNSELGNDYETIWALWLAKELKIEINITNIEKILENTSSITCVLALDIYNKGLVNKEKKEKIIEILKERLGNENFYSEEWILYYELKRKMWFPEFEELEEDEYMKILLDKKIEFLKSEDIDLEGIKVSDEEEYLESLKNTEISILSI